MSQGTPRTLQPAAAGRGEGRAFLAAFAGRLPTGPCRRQDFELLASRAAGEHSSLVSVGLQEVAVTALPQSGLLA